MRTQLNVSFLLTLHDNCRWFTHPQMINVRSVILLNYEELDSISPSVQIYFDYVRVLPVTPASSIEKIIRGTNNLAVRNKL